MDPDPEHCLLEIVRIVKTGHLVDSVGDCIVSILLRWLFFSSQIPNKKYLYKKYFLTLSWRAPGQHYSVEMILAQFVWRKKFKNKNKNKQIYRRILFQVHTLDSNIQITI